MVIPLMILDLSIQLDSFSPQKSVQDVTHILRFFPIVFKDAFR